MIVFCNADITSIDGATFGSQLCIHSTQTHTNILMPYVFQMGCWKISLNCPPSEVQMTFGSIHLRVTLYVVSNKLICLCRILTQCCLLSSLANVFREADKS